MLNLPYLFRTLGVLGFLLAFAGGVHAAGEPIRDIRVQNNTKTLEETIRSIAGLEIGESMESDTLEKIRERLNTAGLFADVDVFWEPFRDGVRVVIAVRDKFPWAPVPTFAYSGGNVSGGLALGHSNLFGRGKRGLVGGRVSNVDSGAIVAYQDPALFGSWGFWNVRGRFQDQVLPEYGNRSDLNLRLEPLRETKLRTFGGEINLGVAWWRKVKTSIGYFYDQTDVKWSRSNPLNDQAPQDLPVATTAAKRALLMGTVTFDFRAREHAIMYGNALSFSLDLGRPAFGSDEKVNYWKAFADYEQGIRFFRRHNLIIRAAGSAGDNMPFWSEPSTTGADLRGFLYRQYMGDTILRTQVEYHFPMFSLGKLDVRGLVFNDAAALWYRNLPNVVGDAYETRPDGRNFLPPGYLVPGFDASRDVHTSVGAGIRFYLKTLSVPLVGVDFGRGVPDGSVRIILVLGA